ncbi:hypothetical protein SUNI508_13012 [Seiridium unicorne]|uniref:Single-strand DNA deaminase toxin A-like C-terminal domain-containing protein n=1 Tax=Seiridium unicorne TaxID=138068 RepID=A0ABR2VEY0_9PEZI
MGSQKLGSLAGLKLQDIHIACLKGDVNALLKILPDNKAIASRTAQGETPLILASLFGQVEIFVILRQHHAPTEAVDDFRRNALAASAENAFNNTRRQVFTNYGFAESEGATYRRIAIAGLLAATAVERKINIGEARGNIGFRTTSDGVQAYYSLGNIKVPGVDPRPKTVGFIRSSIESLPRAWAISGWSDSPSEDSRLLDGNKWTNVALGRAAPAIGFQFKPHINDQGWARGQLTKQERGKFFASHVECQLAVWYCFTLAAAAKSMPNASMTFLAGHLGKLREVDLGDARIAQINLNQPACKSCAKFLQALTKVTNIEFELVYGRSLSLIPEPIKSRNYPLAHESNLGETSDEDHGSDTDNDLEDDSYDEVEDLIDYEGWQSETGDDTLLEGQEEYETLPYVSTQNTALFRFDGGFGGGLVTEQDEANESDGMDDSEVAEDYQDDVIDKSYHCGSARKTRQGHGAEPTMDFNPSTTRSVESDAPGIILGTPIASTPTTPSVSPRNMTPITPFGGTVDCPIEIPPSPTEHMLATRKRRHQERLPKSNQYETAKERSRDGKRLKIKREAQAQGGGGRSQSLKARAPLTIRTSPAKRVPTTPKNVADNTTVTHAGSAPISDLHDHQRLSLAPALSKIQSFTYQSTPITSAAGHVHSPAYFTPIATPPTIVKSWNRIPWEGDLSDDENA